MSSKHQPPSNPPSGGKYTSDDSDHEAADWREAEADRKEFIETALWTEREMARRK